jgi:hypothetical protein
MFDSGEKTRICKDCEKKKLVIFFSGRSRRCSTCQSEYDREKRRQQGSRSGWAPDVGKTQGLWFKPGAGGSRGRRGGGEDDV